MNPMTSVHQIFRGSPSIPLSIDPTSFRAIERTRALSVTLTFLAHNLLPLPRPGARSPEYLSLLCPRDSYLPPPFSLALALSRARSRPVCIFAVAKARFYSAGEM